MSVYGEITRTPLVDVTFPLYNNGISCAGDLLDRSVTCKFIDDNKNTVNTANSTSDNLMITHVNQNKMDTNSIKCENGETEIESTTDKTTNEKTSITCRRPDGNTYNYSKVGADLPSASNVKTNNPQNITTDTVTASTKTTSIQCEKGDAEIESTTDKTTNEKTSITCRRPDGNTYNYSKAGFTSNVYDFKSKRERNVESFSQNNNNKCKARY